MIIPTGMWSKTRIADLASVYTAAAFSYNDRLCIGAGSEVRAGARLIDFAAGAETQLIEGAGGMMSLMPIPGHPDHLVSVMGLFPPFIGAEAGVFLHRELKGGWTTRRLFSLPFAHRCELLSEGGTSHLVIATVAENKTGPEDWSRPGHIYVSRIPDSLEHAWELQPLNLSLLRNHGMRRARFDGAEAICVSGAEGIFALQPSGAGCWRSSKLFGREVSEFDFCDCDGDGVDELATIEPFHGNQLCIYRRDGGHWTNCYRAPLSFGHGLSFSRIGGQCVVVVGNRRDSGALEAHVVRDLAAGVVERQVIETGVCPTQTQIFEDQGARYVLSANQAKDEVAVYQWEESA